MIEAIMKTGSPDKQRKSCFDCRFCRGALSWWCVNKDAVEKRGTAMSGVVGCPYWKPVRSIKDLSLFERLFKFSSRIYIKGDAE